MSKSKSKGQAAAPKNKKLPLKDFKEIFNGLELKSGTLSARKAALVRRENAYDLYQKRDIHAKDSEGKTLLYYAVMAGAKGATQKLIDLGADINQSTSQHGHTLLHDAAEHNKPEMVQFLIDKGVNINAQTTESGYTPLDFADSVTDAQKVLLSNGAKTSVDLKAEEVMGAELRDIESSAPPRPVIPPPPLAVPPPPDLGIKLPPIPTLEGASPQTVIPQAPAAVKPKSKKKDIPPPPNATKPKSEAEATPLPVQASKEPPKIARAQVVPEQTSRPEQQQYALQTKTAPVLFVQIPVITPDQYRQNLNQEMDKFLAMEKDRFLALEISKGFDFKSFDDIPIPKRDQFNIYEKSQVARKENLLQQSFIEEEMARTPPRTQRRKQLENALTNLDSIQKARDNEYYVSVERAHKEGKPYNDASKKLLEDLQYKQNPLIFEGHVDTVKGPVIQSKMDQKIIDEIAHMADKGKLQPLKLGAVNARVVFDNQKDAADFLEKVGSVHKVKGRNGDGKHVYSDPDDPKKFTIYITPGEVTIIQKSISMGNSFALGLGKAVAATKEIDKPVIPAVSAITTPAAQSLVSPAVQPQSIAPIPDDIKMPPPPQIMDAGPPPQLETPSQPRVSPALKGRVDKLQMLLARGQSKSHSASTAPSSTPTNVAKVGQDNGVARP